MAVGAQNCIRCGKLFTHINRKICTSCYEKEEAKFKEIKEYLFKNPNNNVQQVSEDLGVSVRKILEYIKDGRIIASTGIIKEIKCEKCGKEILSGRLCKTCRIKVGQEINTLFDDEKNNKSKGIGMHTYDNTKNKR